MRGIVTVIALLLFAGVLSGQNPMMQDFGSSYGEVHTFLKDRNCNLRLEDEYIFAATGQVTITYHFKSGYLYEMSVEKTFVDRKLADQAFDSFREYYDATGAELIEMEDTRKRGFFVALFRRDLNEITRFKTAGNQFHVKLVSRNLDYYPDENKDILTAEIASYTSMNTVAPTAK